jgi:hypothetical protein
VVSLLRGAEVGEDNGVPHSREREGATRGVERITVVCVCVPDPPVSWSESPKQRGHAPYTYLVRAVSHLGRTEGRIGWARRELAQRKVFFSFSFILFLLISFQIQFSNIQTKFKFLKIGPDVQ